MLPNPFDDASASFLVSGARFAAGEFAIVRVCVTPLGTIESADVVGSSGDRRFDEFAVVYARQVRLKTLPEGLQTVSVCGPVRVEIKAAPMPEALPGRQSALS
jgi:TonB family protein